MNVLIIEDEQPAFKRLSKMIQEVAPAINILAHLDSIESSKEWLQQNPLPELVFMDIHLADGSAFDLLKKVELDCPVIFTTAYDQYAMDAFRAASIDYLLKPVKKKN